MWTAAMCFLQTIMNILFQRLNPYNLKNLQDKIVLPWDVITDRLLSSSCLILGVDTPFWTAAGMLCHKAAINTNI